MSILSRLLTRGTDVLTIAPMRRRDLAEVMPIEQVSYPRPWTEGVFRSELVQARAGERHYVTARRGTALIGYAGLMYAVDDAHVTNIAVAPSMQRMGVGRRLLAELAWAAIDHGSAAMTLEVRASNRAAQALYEQFGFIGVGVRQRYYENVEDAIVMWANDIQDPDFVAHLRTLSPEAAR
ncbi:MAG TPA: ribosomal protein S18-alanine N-acetyltransferase [Ilumatobacteraceae bacterium]|nr:ribosomal protein S18-alanine N-acetyltransferase [Ilumatobacteraceae bacterium]